VTFLARLSLANRGIVALMAIIVTAFGAQASPTPARLGDVATVTDEYTPATSLTRTNGKPSLGGSAASAAPAARP
jgi:multidrug efflux pump subunit AcrB